MREWLVLIGLMLLCVNLASAVFCDIKGCIYDNGKPVKAEVTVNLNSIQKTVETFKHPYCNLEENYYFVSFTDTECGEDDLEYKVTAKANGQVIGTGSGLTKLDEEVVININPTKEALEQQSSGTRELPAGAAKKPEAYIGGGEVNFSEDKVLAKEENKQKRTLEMTNVVNTRKNSVLIVLIVALAVVLLLVLKRKINKEKSVKKIKKRGKG